jgi:hypothetical protein
MTPQNSTDWRHLAEKASTEMDPEKLMNLVIELDRVLEQHQQSPRRIPGKVESFGGPI